MSDMYSVEIMCDNCNYESHINIPKGKPVSDTLTKHECEDCGLVVTCKKTGR